MHEITRAALARLSDWTNKAGGKLHLASAREGGHQVLLPGTTSTVRLGVTASRVNGYWLLRAGSGDPQPALLAHVNLGTEDGGRLGRTSVTVLSPHRAWQLGPELVPGWPPDFTKYHWKHQPQKLTSALAPYTAHDWHELAELLASKRENAPTASAASSQRSLPMTGRTGQRVAQGNILRFCPKCGPIAGWLCEPLPDGSGMATYTCPEKCGYAVDDEFRVYAKPSEATQRPSFRA